MRKILGINISHDVSFAYFEDNILSKYLGRISENNKVKYTFRSIDAIDRDGKIYNHNLGNSFNGSNIEAEYQSPDYDYGDLGTLKTLDYAKIAFTPEGDAQPTLRVRFDYDSLDTPQPADVVLTEIPEPAIFGKALFGTQRFGATEQPLVRQALTGSGHSNFFKIFSADTNAPYAINGLYVNYRPSGRQ